MAKKYHKRARAKRYCSKCNTSHFVNNWVHTVVGAGVTLAVVGGLLGAASHISQRV